MAYILDTNVDLRGRDNSPGGSEVFLMETSNVLAVDVDSANEYVSGITMSGGTYAYSFKFPRENINFINATEINIPFGVFVFRPTVNFAIPGLQVDQLKMFDVLVRKSVTVIVKTNEAKYFIIGMRNGMDLTSNGNYQLGQAATDQIGSNIEMEGLESERIYQIDPDLAESIMSTIVSP